MRNRLKEVFTMYIQVGQILIEKKKNLHLIFVNHSSIKKGCSCVLNRIISMYFLLILMTINVLNFY